MRMDFDGNLLTIISKGTLVQMNDVFEKSEKITSNDVATSIRGKSVIGLYFSSTQCSNCNEFTERLKTSYEIIKRTQSFEVIYISLDNDEENVDNSSSKELPQWLALPSSSKIRAQLCNWLCIRSIPSLILIDGETGCIVCRNAHQRVLEDPTAINFPWSNKSLNSIFNESGLIDSTGAAKTIDEIQGHSKGLYFSANWCPPCKAFTPHLVHIWSQLKNEKSDGFQVIFVSSDRSEDSFNQYFGTMPWLAVPYDQEKIRKELAEIYEVHGIPTLILLDKDDRIITRDGRYEVLEDLEGKNFPWKPNLVEELTDKFSTKLNEAPLLVLFTDSGELEQAKELLMPVAKELKENSQSDCNVLLFFVGGESELCDKIRELAHLEDEVPLLCILDIHREEKYLFEEDVEITANVVREFVKQYLNGDLCPDSFYK